MQNVNWVKKLSLFILLISIFGYSQELPPIIKYSPSIYGAGNQNWTISQDNNRFIYFANNDGLLEFDGSTWTLNPSPNETIIRSVKVIDNKIYTGCYMEFGYWKRQNNGQLKYFSLSNSIKSKILYEEQFWNIINYDQWVVFQSLSRIYIYDTKTGKFKIITPKNSITKAFRTPNAIYFQVLNEGLFEIENSQSKLVSNDKVFKNDKIVAVFGNDGDLLIQTQSLGLFKLVNSNLSKFSTEVDSQLLTNTVYSCQQLSNKNIAIGTISNGIYILSENGSIKYHINQNKGLSNNTALSLFEDLDKNLWVGLDNGINCINLQSPVKSFSDNTGTLGTVYTSILHNGNIYIGTNQGLFYKKYESIDEFKFINGTKGQVWSLFEYQNTLFCGHDSGTFIIENESAKSIFSQSGTWKFEPVPNNPNLVFQGNYYGISILEKNGNQWVFKNKIEGFDFSSRYFEPFNANDLYINHEYKGIYRILINPSLTKVLKVFTYENPKKGKRSSLIKFNNSIYYAYKEGVYKLNSVTKKFDKDPQLSSVFQNDEYTSGKLIVDKSNKIWLFSKNYIHYFSKSKLGVELKQNIIPIPSSLTNSMLGFENIFQLSNSLYLIGATDGYYIININDLSFRNYKVSISNINVNKLNQKNVNCSLTSKGEFKYDENNINFNYTVPDYNKYINGEYQYLLQGFQEEWSEWSAKSTVNFKNLSPGDYTFKVRAKIANSSLENIATYRFKIAKPWYFTNLALILYFIIIVFIANRINRAYKNYYKEKEQNLIDENNLLLEIKELETEQQLMKLRNEQLSQDVDSKSRELAVSTMSLINKNELLTVIKEDLKKTNDDGGNRNIKSVILAINKNISEEDTWRVFKEAFDTADKDFLKKVKLAHPLLTPNDLRLCAYLRLNLSSKEIAPLLNISVRSIEIKRYRLRKKMELTHEQGLVEYILGI